MHPEGFGIPPAEREALAVHQPRPRRGREGISRDFGHNPTPGATTPALPRVPSAPPRGRCREFPAARSTLTDPRPRWCSSMGTIPIRGRSSVANPWISAPVGSAGSALGHLTELLPPHCSQDGNPSRSPTHTEYPQALKGRTPSWLTLRVREQLDEKPGQTGIQCCRERWLGVAAVCCGFQAAP